MFNSRSGTPETEVDVSIGVILGLFSLYGGVCAFYHYPIPFNIYKFYIHNN